jgi:hypothetical protein
LDQSFGCAQSKPDDRLSVGVGVTQRPRGQLCGDERRLVDAVDRRRLLISACLLGQDVAMATTFGGPLLESMTVRAEEV